MNYETCGRLAGDLRKTRERPAKDPRKDVPIREAGKCTGVPVYQHFSKTYPCVRAGVFMELAGTLVHWFTLPTYPNPREGSARVAGRGSS